jgi:hypothetical protein
MALVQYNADAYIEFLLTRHDCKAKLLNDIINTEFMGGITQTGRAIEKAVVFGFTPRRVSD